MVQIPFRALDERIIRMPVDKEEFASLFQSILAVEGK